MERSNFFANSYGTSWADQWDDGPDPIPDNNKKKSSRVFGFTGASSKPKQDSNKGGEGLDRTKAVAATGLNKAKVGASFGFRWIKEKYNQRKKNKNKSKNNTKPKGKRMLVKAITGF